MSSNVHSPKKSSLNIVSESTIYSSIETRTDSSPPIKETDVEIIRLECVSDEKDSSKSAPSLCSNPICGNKTDLQLAPNFVCAYFGLTLEKNQVRKVCQSCYKDAENHQTVLVELLREKKSIILGPKKPKNYLVTIDEEEVIDDQTNPPEQIEVEGDITTILQEMMDTYRFDQQTNDTVNYLGSHDIIGFLKSSQTF